MCGKNPYLFSFCWFSLGSPPHVREKQSRRDYDRPQLGITPACAEKTLETALQGSQC